MGSAFSTRTMEIPAKHNCTPRSSDVCTWHIPAEPGGGKLGQFVKVQPTFGRQIRSLSARPNSSGFHLT